MYRINNPIYSSLVVMILMLVDLAWPIC